MEFCLRKDGLLETAAEIQRNLGMTYEKTGKKMYIFFKIGFFLVVLLPLSSGGL